MNNINIIINKFNKCADFIYKKEIINNENYYLFFLSSLINQELLFKIFNNILMFEYNQEILNIKDTINEILIGNLIIIFPNNKIYSYDIKKYPYKAISSPEVERSVRGSKDSFTENIVDNIALIRRRIKTCDLCICNYIISKKSKMNIAVIYLNNLVDKKALRIILSRIKKINLESLIMSDRALEETIVKQKYNVFPLTRYTERPDVASINLIRGKIVILVDTSSNALILPISIFDHFKNVEEYKQNPLIGSFTKTLRLIGSLISMFLVPLFILFTIEDGYNNGIIPLYKLKLSNPLLIEVSIVSMILEIIRIAIVHTPNALISSLSMLTAIILGEISISLGLFSSEILLVTSLAIVCNFATPSYELSLANRFVSMFLILLTCIFKVKGFLMGIFFLFIYLTHIKILSVPYLYPICPFDFDMFKNLFIRRDSKKKK